MKESFSDLKFNLANRLSKVEQELGNADKVFLAKTEQDKKDTAFDTRLEIVETGYQRIVGGLILLNVLLGILMLYFHH
jgi:hypothetical protein